MGKMFRQKYYGKILVLSILMFTSLVFSGIEKEPYLLFEGKNSEMSVMWQMTSKQSCKISWGKTDSYELGEATTSEYGDAHQHTYRIKNLRANSLYFYKVDGVGEGSFRTAPAASTARTRFFAYGDTRLDKEDVGQNDHDSVAARILKRIDEQPSLQTAVFFSGDYVGAGRKEEDWKKQFFNRDHKYLMKLHAKIPNIGVIGNHEGTGGSKLLKKYYPFPYFDKDMHYWAFNYGSARVFIIDQFSKSDYVLSDKTKQHAWLKEELNSCDREWKIVIFHRPGYSAAGGHDNDEDIQLYLQPLFEEYEVDFVITGDNHYYSRAVVKGVQHITTGGGGAPVRPPEKNQPHIVKIDKSNHFCEFDINGNRATVIARRADGSIIETFTVKHDNVAPVIVSNPKDDTVKVGDAYLVELECNDPDEFEVEKWALTIDGVEKDDFDGILEWTPEKSDIGVHNVIATITDRGAASDTAQWKVTVKSGVSIATMGQQLVGDNVTATILGDKVHTKVQLDSRSVVSIALFNLRGQRIHVTESKILAAGVHDISAPFVQGTGMYVVQITINDEKKTMLVGGASSNNSIQ